MSTSDERPRGVDLAAGVRASDVPDGGMLAGHVGGRAVLLARRGDELFAIGGECTHYGASLADGIFTGYTVRCPWHHACFDVRTGEATCAPALNPVGTWTVERSGDTARVVAERPAADGATAARSRRVEGVDSIVIVGAGAAGNAAAEMLRREGYDGAIALIGDDDSVPYDRPNLSKDYLAGNAPEEWIPLRPPEFYGGHGIDLVRGRRVVAIDAGERRVRMDGGAERRFDRLLIATGAAPVRLDVPGADRPHVRYLRSLADSRAIIERAGSARRAVVLGASFIGLEVAASLRTRGLEVHVVAPEEQPLERVMGAALGRFVRGVHEAHGVVFHLGRVAASIGADSVTLDNGESLAADLIVAGIGVRPLVELAERAGIATDRGVVVDEFLETSVPGIFAAGDVARFPDGRGGERIRVEHWVVAERQGQTAARNMLGAREPFASVPFFWSQHYDIAIRYAGHAARWDDVAVAGDLTAGDATVTFREGGKVLAVATVGRDRASLEAELAMEGAG